MYTSPQRSMAGIGSGSLDALRVQLFKMSPQQLQAFAMANQDDAVKLGLAAEADKVHKTHTQEHMALMSGQQPQPPVAQQILQSIGQPPQQPQGQQPQGQQPQGQPQQGMPPQQPQGQGPMPPQGMPPQGQMPPQGMPPQGHADGGYMLPEEQGIATLPVGNMDFAEGGIVAFGPGGEVPYPNTAPVVSQNNATGSLLPASTYIPDPSKYVRSTDGGKNWFLDMPETIRDPSVPYYKQIPNPIAAGVAGKTFTSRQAAIDAVKTLSGTSPNVSPAPVAKDTSTDFTGAMPTAVNAEEQDKMFRARTAAPPPPPPPPAPKAEAAARMPAITPVSFERTSLPDINIANQIAQYDSAMPKNIVDPLAAQRAEANAPAIQAAARQVSMFEQEVQKRKPAFEDRIKKLDEKEARVNSMDDRNLNMSLLEAGLAMMSGESPHAFVNIGKGAQVGMKSYAEGQARVEAARDKMEEARARIEEFRRSEDMMTAKERRAVLRDYDNTVAAASRDMFSGVEKMYGIKRDDIKTAIADKNARDAVKAQLQSSESLGIAGLTEQMKRAQLEQSGANIRTASTNAAHLTAIDKQLEMYKGPMHVEQVRKDVAAELAKNINFKTASPEEQAGMIESAIQTRAKTDPLLRQFLGTTGGGGAPGLRFNPQTGKIE